MIFVVDGREGLVPGDLEIAKSIRRLDKPVVLAVNKTDDRAGARNVAEFHRLGFDPVFEIAAEHGAGIGDLLDRILDLVPKAERPDEPERLRIAVVGRPNVGKSSLVNAILGQPRTIVSDVPGTTRDAIDTPFEFEGRSMLLVDTAGIRRKGKTKLMAEKLSVVMARKHLESADVALLMIDAVEGVTALDTHIAGLKAAPAAPPPTARPSRASAGSALPSPCRQSARHSRATLLVAWRG